LGWVFGLWKNWDIGVGDLNLYTCYLGRIVFVTGKNVGERKKTWAAIKERHVAFKKQWGVRRERQVMKRNQIAECKKKGKGEERK